MLLTLCVCGRVRLGVGGIVWDFLGVSTPGQGGPGLKWARSVWKATCAKKSGLHFAAVAAS